jgi:hypothetical protein
MRSALKKIKISSQLKGCIVDTTVPSAYYDDRASDRKQLTRIFWAERLPDFNPIISNIVL